VLNALPTSHSTPELNVQCTEGEPRELVQKLLKSAKFPGAKITKIDGLRADFKDGFGLIRASNTTPVLVMRFEGHTKPALKRIEKQFMAALLKVKPDAKIVTNAH
jgi:phosphomannomutase